MMRSNYSRARTGPITLPSGGTFLLGLLLLVAIVLMPSEALAKKGRVRVSGAEGYSMMADCATLDGTQMSVAGGSATACCSKELHYCVVCVGSDYGSALCDVAPYRSNTASVLPILDEPQSTGVIRDDDPPTRNDDPPSRPGRDGNGIGNGGGGGTSPDVK